MKWQSDEICLMTRKSGDSIEYQILYLPKSSSAEDFTVFEWSDNILDVWDKLVAVLETQHADMLVFKKGPWAVFGITSRVIQSRVASDGSAPLVTGVLKCDSRTGVPTVASYREYMSFRPEDSEYEWILENILNDETPYCFSQHVSESSIYWVDCRTGVSTWAHPLYQKYASMLVRARIRKPLSDAKSIMHFQLEFLVDSASSHLETIENVLDAARIFKIKITQEPYLVHPLLSCVRFYSVLSRPLDLSTRPVEDTLAAIERKRRDVTVLQKEVSRIKTAAVTDTSCIECTKSKAAMIHCSDCEDLFCEQCYENIHASGSRKNSHVRTVVELALCSECTLTVSMFHCVNCGDVYCARCLEKIHMRGGRRNHVQVVLRRPGIQNCSSSGEKSILLLDQAMSPWIQLTDGDGLVTNYNLVTNESRRDSPLAVINFA